MTLLLCPVCYHPWICHGPDGCEELTVQDDDSMAGCQCRALAEEQAS